MPLPINTTPEDGSIKYFRAPAVSPFGSVCLSTFKRSRPDEITLTRAVEGGRGIARGAEDLNAAVVVECNDSLASETNSGGGGNEFWYSYSVAEPRIDSDVDEVVE